MARFELGILTSSTAQEEGMEIHHLMMQRNPLIGIVSRLRCMINRDVYPLIVRLWMNVYILCNAVVKW